MTMQSFHDRVAEAILSEYDHLPMKYKPACCNAGIRNWVPLSGLALVDGKSKSWTKSSMIC